MNIYDTANNLAAEIRKSEEYNNYKLAKESNCFKFKPKR